MYVCMNECTYECMYVCMYVCMNVCMYECMNVCMHACLYICLYDHPEVDRIRRPVSFTDGTVHRIFRENADRICSKEVHGISTDT